MKKNIVMVAILCASFMRGMEPENKWSITVYGTKINLYKKDILEHYADENNKIDTLICVGQHKQEELGEVSMGGNLTGECWEQKTVRFIPKEDSINYQKARICGWYFPQKEDIRFLVVTEPLVYNRSGGDSKYWCNDSEVYTQEEAITESCKGLLRCYNAVLNKGIELLKEKNVKNIAFPILGADSKYEYARMFKNDAALIAVNSIVELLKNKRGAYNSVELFAEEDADCALYEKLLMEACNREKNILLFLLVHQKDSENILSLLPRELIHYIAKLV